MESVYPKHKFFESELAAILEGVKTYHPNLTASRVEKITRVFWFAAQAHEGQIRFSGTPYFNHPIEVTKILLRIKPDIDTICACILHDVIEDTTVTAKELEDLFGSEIRFLCEGVEKVSKVRMQGKQREFESLRKLFMAMASDIRVIFIKLADRLHNLQTLDYVRPEKQQRIARESLEIYVPVADRLSIHEFKAQMQDLCFKRLKPADYDQLVLEIDQVKKNRENYLRQAQSELKNLLDGASLENCLVTGREKNLYSVYHKIRRKNYSGAYEVHDIVGLRVLIPADQDCYRVLGLIHARWKPIPGRFKDYIAVPKPNGYQSLHTTVLGLGGSEVPTEIQIRTQKMHQNAEFGPAAHWFYKLGGTGSLGAGYLKDKNEWINETLPLSGEGVSSQQFFQAIAENLNRERVMVFTPQGDIKNLSRDASLVDFAYSIHTQVGDSCVGAKVDGLIKPLSYRLKGGEVVEIITKKGRTPNPAWLEFVVSTGARQKIQRHVSKLREAETYSATNLESHHQVVSKKVLPAENFVTDAKLGLKKFALVIGGEVDMPFRLARCCTPTPKDMVMAFNTRGKSFAIHRADCKVAAKLDAARLMEAYFIIERQIKVSGADRENFIHDCTKIIKRHQINIWDARFKRLKNNQFYWLFTLHIENDQGLANLKKLLEDLPNVTNVSIVK